MRSLSLAFPERTLGRLIVVLLLRHPRRPEVDALGVGEALGDARRARGSGRSRRAARARDRSCSRRATLTHANRTSPISPTIGGQRLALGLGLVAELGAQLAQLALRDRRTHPPRVAYSKPIAAARRCTLRASSSAGSARGTSWKMPSRPSLSTLTSSQQVARVARGLGALGCRTPTGGAAAAWPPRRARRPPTRPPRPPRRAAPGRWSGRAGRRARRAASARGRPRARRRRPRRPPRRCAGRSRSPSAARSHGHSRRSTAVSSSSAPAAACAAWRASSGRSGSVGTRGRRRASA